MSILYTALAILKKHYHNLWRSFPDDHMMTLSTLCESFNVHPEAIEMVTACRSSDEANRTILNYIIFITKGDHQIMEFCNLMQKLINNPRLSKITSDLRSGVCASTEHSTCIMNALRFLYYRHFSKLVHMCNLAMFTTSTSHHVTHSDPCTYHNDGKIM